MLKLSKNIKKRRWENLEYVILSSENKPDNIESFIRETNLEKELLMNSKLAYNKNWSIYDNLLLAAVWENRIIIVDWLLNKKNVEVWFEDAEHANGLHIAIQKKNFKMAELFVDARALSNFLDQPQTMFGKIFNLVRQKPFHNLKNHPDNLMTLAVDKGEVKIVNLLLNNYNSYSKLLLSDCLFLAAQKGYYQIVETLIATKNVDINHRKINNTIFKEVKDFLYYKPQGPIVEAIKNNHPEVVERFIKAGAKTTFGEITCIQFAAHFGFIAILEILIKYNVNDINASFKALSPIIPADYDAILFAVQNRQHETVKFLIANGAHYDREYTFGRTKTLYEIALETEPYSKSCEYIKNASRIKADADKLKVREARLQTIETQKAELKIKEKNNSVKTNKNQTSIDNNFYPKTIASSLKPKPKKVKQKQTTLKTITTKNNELAKVNSSKKNKERKLKDKVTKLTNQSTELDNSIMQYEKAQQKAKEHENVLAVQRELDLVEQHELSQLRISENFNSNQFAISEARKDLVTKIDKNIWRIFRNETKDHQQGRPGIKIATIGDKVIVLIATTKDVGKNRPHLAIQLSSEGPKSYFCMLAIVDVKHLVSYWGCNVQVSRTNRIVVSNLVEKKFLKLIFPNRLFDQQILTSHTQKHKLDNIQNINATIKVDDQQLLAENSFIENINNSPKPAFSSIIIQNSENEQLIDGCSSN